MRHLAERIYFAACLASGRMLRAARYSRVRFAGDDYVRKRRLFYAPLLVSMGARLLEILDAGVRILPRREWAERERRIYETLYGASIRTDVNGILVLPLLSGRTLAALLQNPRLDAPARKKAIELAVLALVEFHQRGFTHGDAIADNVLVDLDSGVARWFDFETVHESSRHAVWRQADDLRALLATTLLRIDPGQHAATLGVIVDLYGNREVTRVLISMFTSAWRRPLTFRLAQAPLSFQCFREVARLLEARCA